MWDWIASHVDVLTFLVLTATLVAVVSYTRAAFQQAEGLLKPCLTPDFSEVRYEPAPADGFPFPATLSGGTLVLRNIGAGPALNVRYWLRDVEEPWGQAIEHAPHGAPVGPGSPVGPGEAFDTGYSKRDLPEVAVYRIVYESLTGKKYESTGVIWERRVVGTLQFRRVWWASDLRHRRMLDRKLDRKSATVLPESRARPNGNRRSHGETERGEGMWR